MDGIIALNDTSENLAMSKPILCLDFDGVCSDYRSGWQGVDVCNDPPVRGLEDFLAQALEHFAVQVHSSRSGDTRGRMAMYRWFCEWFPEVLVHRLAFPVDKPPAMVTLDDRAVTFTGTWPDVQALLDFQPWTRHSAPPGEKPQ
jgi:hypothetical protein